MKMMNRRSCLPAIVSAPLCFVVLPACAPSAYPQGREAACLFSEQELPFSDGLVAGNAPSFAGQQGTDVMGKLEGGISDQVRAALETIKKVVTRAGFFVKDGERKSGGQLPIVCTTEFNAEDQRGWPPLPRSSSLDNYVFHDAAFWRVAWRCGLCWLGPITTWDRGAGSAALRIVLSEDFETRLPKRACAATGGG